MTDIHFTVVIKPQLSAELCRLLRRPATIERCSTDYWTSQNAAQVPLLQ